MARFIHNGDSIDYTPSGAVTAGDVVVLGDLIGVAKVDIAVDVQGALALTGVFEMPKATGGGTAIAVGKTVYWDVADGEVKEDAEAGANKQFGKVVIAAADADAVVLVKKTI